MFYKLGKFLVFFGILLFVLFYLSDVAAAEQAIADPSIQPNYNLFFASVGCLLLGGYWMRKHYTPPEKSTRFQRIREYLENQEKKRIAKLKR
ncbi:MAG: hypothetical protein OHK0052_04300 [Anaerolineales bacterium]